MTLDNYEKSGVFIPNNVVFQVAQNLVLWVTFRSLLPLGVADRQVQLLGLARHSARPGRWFWVAGLVFETLRCAKRLVGNCREETCRCCTYCICWQLLRSSKSWNVHRIFLRICMEKCPLCSVFSISSARPALMTWVCPPTATIGSPTWWVGEASWTPWRSWSATPAGRPFGMDQALEKLPSLERNKKLQDKQEQEAPQQHPLPLRK